MSSGVRQPLPEIGERFPTSSDRFGHEDLTISWPVAIKRRALLETISGGVVLSLAGCNTVFGNGQVSEHGFGPPRLMSDALGVSISDGVFTKILQAIKTQRPSLLNYASPYFISQPADFPNPVPPPANGAPIATTIDGIKVSPNTHVPLVDLVAQIEDAAVSFGIDKVGLPASLLPLASNAIAVKLMFNGRTRTPHLDNSSLGFPDDPDQFANAEFSYTLSDSFPINVFLVLSCRLLSHGDDIWLAYSINGFSSSLLQPAQLASAVNQIVVLLADTVLLPRSWAKISGTKIDLTDITDASSPYRALTAIPRLGGAAPNPLADADTLSVSLNIEVKPA